MENEKLPQDMDGKLLKTGNKIKLELEIQGFQLNGLLDCVVYKADGNKVEYYIHRSLVKRID